MEHLRLSDAPHGDQLPGERVGLPGAAAVPRLPALQGVTAAQAPAWGHETVHRVCPVCGKDDPRPFVVRPSGDLVSRCVPCGHHYLASIPAPEALSRFYAQYAADFKRLAKLRSRSALRLWLDGVGDTMVASLEAHGGLHGRRVLEVGPGRGDLLHKLRARGAECAAVEIDAGTAAELREEGFTMFSQVPSDGSYDAAVALQVLEHLASPHDLLVALHRIVRPNGRALIAVPNAGEIAMQGPYWVGFRVDLEHLNYFSPADLSRLLARSGFYVEHHWVSAQPQLYRPDEACSTSRRSPATRMRRHADRLGRLVLGTGRAVQQGSYGVTLLARRV